MKKENTAREPHALDGVVILNSDNDWERLLKEWEKPMRAEDRISWLQNNYVRSGNGPEKFIFYLDLADHYGEDADFFSLPLPGRTKGISTNRGIFSLAELNSNLSKQAFVVLSERFFKPFLSDDGTAPCPLNVPCEEPLFSKLVWFFRPYEGYGGHDNLRPLHTNALGKDGGRHYIENVNTYARHFCIDAWYMLNETWRPGWNVSDAPDPEIAWPLRREIIALMRHLDHIDLIESEQYAPTPRVFKEIILSLCEEDNTPCTSEDLDSKLFVSEVIAELARKSHPWAASLFVASAKMEWRTALAGK